MITTAHIISRVNGTLSEYGCNLLAELAIKVPDDGIILDLGTGEGRSTIAMANALERADNHARILSVETHVRDIRSETPHEDGSILNYLKNLRHFRLLSYVIPVVSNIDSLTSFLSKRSVNLLVFQVNPYFAMEDQTETAIDLAKNVIRKFGTMVFITPVGMDESHFGRFLANRIESEYELKLEKGGVYVYEYIPKKD